MMQLTINDAQLVISYFGQDSDYSSQRGSCVLDRSNLSIQWILDDNELDADLLSSIDKHPERYLAIPTLNHDDHHDILRMFIGTEWTDDVQLREAAKTAYLPMSIGAWREKVNDRTWNEFDNFRETRCTELLTAFFNQHGFEPEYQF